MSQVAVLSKTGYDPFITFMKGYAILCVLLAHALPNPDATGYALWGGMQVPLFLLIQVFHSFKKEPHFSFAKLMKRAVLPFLLIQFVLVALACRHGDVYNQLIISTIGGGRGPGSYYFWLYLQFAVLLPLLYPLTKKLKRSQLLIIFLLVSEGCEVLSSLLHIPEPVYRLLCLRYLFLIYLGIEWVLDGIVINTKTLLLSLVSVAAIIYFTYFDPSLEPFFFKTAWRYHRWICYYYVAYLLAWLLSLVYNAIRNVNWLDRFFKTIGKASYEIYLVQMAVFTLFSRRLMSFFPETVGVTCYVIIALAVSIIGGIVYHRLWSKYVLRI